MKKNGFTLVEIIISLAIIAAIAGISMPVIYSNVIKIEQDSTVESSMNGLRQFFVDARAKSIKNEEAFELKKNGNTNLKTLEFTGTRTGERLRYNLPTGVRTHLVMDITTKTTTNNSTLTYLLGLFLNNNGSEYVIEKDFTLTVRLTNGAAVGTLSIRAGLPVLEE